jgi:hypothetical protein
VLLARFCSSHFSVRSRFFAWAGFVEPWSSWSLIPEQLGLQAHTHLILSHTTQSQFLLSWVFPPWCSQSYPKEQKQDSYRKDLSHTALPTLFHICWPYSRTHSPQIRSSRIYLLTSRKAL